MEEKVENIQSRIQEMYEYQLDPAFIEDKRIDLEDRSRRNNLSIDGINEKPNETWEDGKGNSNHKMKTDKSEKNYTWGGGARKLICAKRRLL